MKFVVFKKETLLFFLAIGVVLVSLSAWFILKAGDTAVFNQQGKEMEVYRWDPGTVFLEKDEKVRLFINGINGEEHPFYIEGTKIKGNVKKGEETVVPLQFEKEGTYRLICEVHSDRTNNGPMIGYIVVD